MIRLLKREEIDARIWDQRIIDSSNGTIYNLSWYLDHVSPSWLVLADEDYKHIMPLPFKKKLGIKLIYQPFFSRQCGVFSHEASGISHRLFLEKIPAEFRYVNLCLDLTGKEFIPSEFRIRERKFQKLTFGNSMEETKKKYSDNAKRNIKKAHKNNLRFVFSEDVNSLVHLFRQQKGSQVRELKSENYLQLKSLMQTGINNGYGKVAEVWSGNRLVVSAYFWWFKNEVIYLKGTFSDEGRNSGAMYYLFDEIISYSHNNFSFLDFGGSDIPSIASFFKRLGGEDQTYTCICRDRSPSWFRIARSARNSLKRRK